MSTLEFAPEGFTDLVIADDEGITEREKKAWIDLGYKEPRVLTSLQAAVENIERRKPAVILCDHRFGDAGTNGVALMKMAMSLQIPVVIAISGIFVKDTEFPQGVVNATGNKHDVYRLQEIIWGQVRKIAPSTSPSTPPSAIGETSSAVSCDIVDLSDALSKMRERIERACRITEDILRSESSNAWADLVKRAARTLHGLQTRGDWVDSAQRKAYLDEFRRLDMQASDFAGEEQTGFRRIMHDLANSLGVVDFIEPETLPLRLKRALPVPSFLDRQKHAVEAWLQNDSRFVSTEISSLAECLKLVTPIPPRLAVALRNETLEIDDIRKVELVIVEDEQDWRKIIQRHALDYFYKHLIDGYCITCDGGDKASEQIQKWAVEYANRKNPKIPASSLHGIQPIFCIDLMLPEDQPQGIELLREIRKSGLACPVIILTSGADNYDIRREIRLLGVECTDYLLKDRTGKERLNESLDRWLRQRTRVRIEEREGVFYFNDLWVDITEGEKQVLRSMANGNFLNDTSVYMDRLVSMFDGSEHFRTITSLVANSECSSIKEPQAMLDWLRANHPRKLEEFVRIEQKRIDDVVVATLATARELNESVRIEQQQTEITNNLIQLIQDFMLQLSQTQSQSVAIYNHVYNLRDKVRTAFAANGWHLDPFKDFIVREGSDFRLAWNDETYIDAEVDSCEFWMEDDDVDDENGHLVPEVVYHQRPRTTTRVLVLDGDPSSRKLISDEFLGWRCDVKSAATIIDAFNAAVQFQPDILCVDPLAPSYDGEKSPANHLRGVDFLSLMRTLLPDARTIVLSDWEGGDELWVAAERAGVRVHDFLPKNAAWKDALLRSLWRIETEMAQEASVLPPKYAPPVVEYSNIAVRIGSTTLSGKQANLLSKLARAHPGAVTQSVLKADETDDSFKGLMKNVRIKLVSHLPMAVQYEARKWVIKEDPTSDGCAYVLNAIVRRLNEEE